MWVNYSTRDAAEFVGLSESAVRSCVRDGLLAGSQARLRFSFRDLAVLKLIKALADSGMSIRRVRRELAALRKNYPPETPLSSLPIEACQGHVVIRESKYAWRADNGQGIFGFDVAPAADIAPMPERHRIELEPVTNRSAEEWFEHALSLEEEDPDAAVAAYEHVLRLKLDHAEALINMGRLHAESNRTEKARYCFERANEINPEDATPLYNLGVVAQDAGEDDRAIACYCSALELEPSLAEAHYNLATIYDRNGDAQAAIRHINAYRRLLRGEQG